MDYCYRRMKGIIILFYGFCMDYLLVFIHKYTDIVNLIRLQLCILWSAKRFDMRFISSLVKAVLSFILQMQF